MKYKGNSLNEISFPLGGIGTGSIGLAGNGRLIDWEIYNKPNKGSINGYSHIAVTAKTKGKSCVKVLNGDITKDLIGQFRREVVGYGYGVKKETMAGFPHFRECEFIGEFPFAQINFFDDDFPGKPSLAAFNPLIPNDSLNSSIPSAFFEVKITNDTDDVVEYSSVFTLSNPFDKSINLIKRNGDFSGVMLTSQEQDLTSVSHGDLSIFVENATMIQPYWYRGQWCDPVTTYWNELSGDGLTARNYETCGHYDICSVSKSITLKPGESGSVKFILAWNFPTMKNWWDGGLSEELKSITWKNYYATVFENSVESAVYCLKNWDSLYAKTEKFKNELFSSTYEPYIIDAVSSTLSVLKSPTVFRLENGEFYGFEGVHQYVGSCEGTCQHVYNYAYALAFLFPDLERSIRQLEFDHVVSETGGGYYRLLLPLREALVPDKEKYGRHFTACLDGQMGIIFKSYREWKLSGNSEWLKKNWDKIKLSLEFAWSDKNPSKWDFDKDGVLEGAQHHTLDMELFGPSSWLEGLYLIALKSGAEMAEFLGENNKKAEYLDLYEKGKKFMKENLFNGEYFYHKIDLSDKSMLEQYGEVDRYWNEETKQIKYQVATGCEIDQMLAQWHAEILGLGDVFDKDQMKTALKNLYKYNFKPSMRNVVNCWRIFSLNDDAGTVMCSYPNSETKPKIPITYCEETMHGFEYAFAGLLYSQGFIDEGNSVVKAVRDHYQGHNRNPWNELECGSNYVRSMASYALLPILSGFKFDMVNGMIGFNPIVNKDNFRTVWSLDGAWGNALVRNNSLQINIFDGNIALNTILVPDSMQISALEIDGKTVEFTQKSNIITFNKQNIGKSIILK